jgi:hypothetical protein
MAVSVLIALTVIVPTLFVALLVLAFDDQL